MKIKEAVLYANILIYIGRNTEGGQHPAGSSLGVLLLVLKRLWQCYDMEGFPSPDKLTGSRAESFTWLIVTDPSAEDHLTL